MRKTVETMNMSKETELFNEIIDLFFGMIPAKRHWILVTYYLAKNNKLAVIDNYAGDGFVMAQLDFDLVEIDNPQKAEYWKQNGIKDRSVVATVFGEERRFIENLYKSFDQNRPDDPRYGIFGKRRMEPSYLVWMAEKLISFSDEWYSQNTKWAIDSVMKKMIDDDRLIDQLYQPKEVTDLALMLLDAKNGSVYNPYAGVGSYGVGLDSDCKYYGQEISEYSTIGKLLFLINNSKCAEYKNEDSVTEWKGGDNYDYIMSTPPFKVKCNSKYRSCDIDFLARASEDAKKKAIGVFRSGICFSARDDKNSPIVELVEKDWLEYVISLPQGLFTTTAIPTVMLVINKFKSNKGVVRFVDASDCFVESRRGNILTPSNVIDLIKGQNPGKSVDVDINTIKENECIIFPGYYLYNQIDVPAGFELHSLNEYLSKESRPDWIEEHEQGAKLFSHLNSHSQLDMGVVSSNDLEYKILDAKAYQKVNTNCFVLSILRNVDLYYLKTDGETVAIPHFYHQIVVKSDSLDPQYLLFEMKKDYLVSQIERFGKSSAGYSSAMKVEDFLNLKVLVPNTNSISTQRSIVDASYFAAKMAQVENLHLQDVINKKNEEYEQEVIKRKHDMRPYIRNLNSIGKSIRRKANTISDDDSKAYILERLDKFQVNLQELSDLLENLSNDCKFGKATTFELDYFLRDFVSKIDRSSDNITIKYSVNTDKIGDAGFIILGYDEELGREDIVEFKPLNVKICREDLLRVVNNIFENAKKHGFTNKDQEYNFDVSLTVNGRYFQIDFANNGNPFPKGMTKEKYGTLGDAEGATKGTGKGGNIVKEIVEHFGGQYEIICDEKCPTVRIKLPIADENE